MARTAVVTGAGQGIGRAVAVELAGLGYRVVAVDVDLTRATDTARLVGGRAVRCDVGDPAAVPAMAGGGAIVNISSVSAALSLTGAGIYAATKAGVETITRQLAQSLAPKGIRVNAVGLRGRRADRRLPMNAVNTLRHKESAGRPR